MDNTWIGLLPENVPHARAVLLEMLEIARRTRHGRSERLDKIASLFANFDPDYAVEIARSISDAAKRREALDCVVYVVAERDPQQALAIARGVRPKLYRVKALATVLMALEPGSPFIAPVTDEAERIARSIERRDRRDTALDSIVDWLAELDAERAMEIALSIRRPKLRAQAMRRVVGNIGKHDLERALEIARGVKHLGSADTVKEIIADELAETAPDKAMRLARSISGPARRTWAMFWVGAEHARRRKSRLRKAHGRLLSLAHRIRNPYYPDTTPSYRASALAWLARAWTGLKLAPPKPLRDELARVVRDLDRHDPARVEIAEAMVHWDPETAREIIEGVESHPSLIWVLEDIVCKLAAADLQRAVSAAARIKRARDRAYALRLAGETLAAVDAADALAMIRPVKPKRARMSLMRGWAEEVSRKDQNRALAAARREPDPDVREQMTIAIAGVLACTDLRKAMKVASTIADDHTRYDALFAIAWSALP